MEKSKYSVAFGKFLQIARNMEGLTSKELSKKLQIGDSFYRMMESGSANIQSWHILSLIKTFSRTTIDYASLSVVISAMETISREENKNDCLQDLICAIPRLRLLKNFTEDSEKNGKIILELVSSSLDEDRENLFKSFSISATKKMQECFAEIIKEGFKEMEKEFK
jgi:transcriptional regulator with XRE-family HTH domain